MKGRILRMHDVTKIIRQSWLDQTPCIGAYCVTFSSRDAESGVGDNSSADAGEASCVAVVVNVSKLTTELIPLMQACNAEDMSNRTRSVHGGASVLIAF